MKDSHHLNRWVHVRWFRNPLPWGGYSWILGLQRGRLVGWGEIRPFEATKLPFEEGLYTLQDLLDRGSHIPKGFQFALESALWDLQAKEAGVTLPRWLNISPHQKIATHAFVYPIPRDSEWEGVLWRKGYRVIKTKVRSLEDIRAWLSHPPQRMRVRLDANRHLLPFHVDDLVAMLSDLPLDFIEEPFPPDALAAYEKLQEKGVSVALDESLREDVSLSRRADLWQVAVIKPALEGFWPYLQRKVHFFQAQGIPVVLTHVLEGSVGRRHALLRAFLLDLPGIHGLDIYRGSPLDLSKI